MFNNIFFNITILIDSYKLVSMTTILHLKNHIHFIGTVKIKKINKSVLNFQYNKHNRGYLPYYPSLGPTTTILIFLTLHSNKVFTISIFNFNTYLIKLKQSEIN